MRQIVFLVKITLITGMGNNMQPASLMSQDFLDFFLDSSTLLSTDAVVTKTDLSAQLQFYQTSQLSICVDQYLPRK